MKEQDKFIAFWEAVYTKYPTRDNKAQLTRLVNSRARKKE